MPGAINTTTTTTSNNNIMKTWNKESSPIRIAVIESNLRVSGHACTVFHIMLEDNKNHFSLVRFIQDFEELDALLVKHFPKHRIQLPKLIDTSALPTKKSSLFSSIKNKKKKKSTNKKSNSELLEHYLYNCILGQIGYSSLFRDFLSAQRDEDRIITKVSVRQLVAQHVTSPSPLSPATSASSSQQQNDLLMTPPPSHSNLKRKRSDTSSKCQQQEQPNDCLVVLPPSPPSSISITPSLSLNRLSITQFPEYRHDSGLTSSLYNDDKDDFMMCSSILGQKEEQQIYQQQQRQQAQAAVKVDNNYNSTLNDFQLIQCLGRGASSKVILVREKSSRKLFALKSITKSWNITRREVDHIRMERDILATLSEIHHPFLVRLYRAFQDVQNLYLVLDYHAGADLATLLQRYICLPAEQCRLYAAEIVMGLQELHRHCILYRDLKPENVLLASDGHIVLTDFGLSKMFDDDDKYEHRTTTFCGTPEYLAPEIILQEEEYSYAADFWSLGTMLYEMLTGVTPFAAPTPEEMYDRVLYDDLLFPAKFDPEAMDLIAGLLERDPLNRLGAGFGGVFELRTHAYFSAHLNWKYVHAKRIQPMYVPMRTSETDLSNFDPDFLNMSTHIKEETDEAVTLRQRWLPDACPAGLSANAFRGYSYIDQTNDSSEIPYESELSFFSSEYMLYDEDDDLDDVGYHDDYMLHGANGGGGDYNSLTEQYYYQHDNNSNPPPHFLHHQHQHFASSSTSSIGAAGATTLQKRPLTKFNSHRSLAAATFNYNQNIRNSLVINSSVKDDELSAWRS